MPHMLFVCECHVNIYYPKEVLMRLFFKPSMTKEKKYESHYSNTMWLSYIETLCVFFFIFSLECANTISEFCTLNCR